MTCILKEKEKSIWWKKASLVEIPNRKSVQTNVETVINSVKITKWSCESQRFMNYVGNVIRKCTNIKEMEKKK